MDKNPDSRIEKEKFLKSNVYKKMLENVSRRIGHQVDHGMQYTWKLIMKHKTKKKNVSK